MTTYIMRALALTLALAGCAGETEPDHQDFGDTGGPSECAFHWENQEELCGQLARDLDQCYRWDDGPCGLEFTAMVDCFDEYAESVGGETEAVWQAKGVVIECAYVGEDCEARTEACTNG